MGRFSNSLVVAAVTVAQLGFAAPGFAQSDEAFEAARRVNLAGKQRMLSQLMSKNACLISVGAAPEARQAALGDAVQTFALTHEALRFGSEELGFSPEADPRLLEAIAVVGQDWLTYSGLIDTALENGYVSRPALERIDEVGLVLLNNMNRAVTKIANTYGELLPDMPLLLSLTIDLAGRQRMFSQRAAKEFCLINAGIDIEANRENLARTTQLFSLTLDALISGMPGMVMAAPNEEIRQKLMEIKARWDQSAPGLAEAAAGGAVSVAQSHAVSEEMDAIMFLMNEAVGMYEGSIPE